MVSSCKICGEKTAGNRQYCPECRRMYKGRDYGYSREGGAGLIIAFFAFIALISFISMQITPLIYRHRIFLVVFSSLFLILGVFILIRDFSKEGISKPARYIITISFTLLILTIVLWATHSPTIKDNFPSQQQIDIPSKIENPQETINSETQISPEEELINSCNSLFLENGISKIESRSYEEDFLSASEWIRDNYENSALTPEQKEHNLNYIIENQIPNQGYPLVIVFGSKNEGQVSSKGFFFCNENGII